MVSKFSSDRQLNKPLAKVTAVNTVVCSTKNLIGVGLHGDSTVVALYGTSHPKLLQKLVPWLIHHGARGSMSTPEMKFLMFKRCSLDTILTIWSVYSITKSPEKIRANVTCFLGHFQKWLT